MAQVGRPRSRTDIGTSPPVNEIGTADPQLSGTGVVTLSGQTAPWKQFMDEQEFVPELVWPQSISMFNQMRTDSQIAALYTATVYGASQLRFIIDPNGARPGIVQGISQDLNLPVKGEDGQPRRRMKRRFAHNKHVGQAFLSLLFGHTYFEQVGEIVDMKWRLRKLSPRLPVSIKKFNTADDGGLVSIEQWTKNSLDPLSQTRDIPIDRLVGFIFNQEGSSPIGRSIIRELYKDWLIKDRLLRVEANNHERAGGIPYATAPMGATAGDIADLDAMMRAFRSGPASGGALPYGAELHIAKGSGGDIDKTIRRYDESMARRFMLMLANLAQGGQHVGSYALADQFNDFFFLGQRAIVNWYCDTMNEHVIEDWVDWNYGEDEDLSPLLTWERTSEDSLGVGQLADLVDKGVILVDDEIENAVRYKYQLPQRTGPRPDPAQLAAGPGSDAPSSSDPAANQPAATAASHRPFDWEHDTRVELRVNGQSVADKMVADVMASSPSLVTVPNVPILEAGVEYDLSTGKTTFTPEDLADAVAAANDDFSIPSPRHKIGHIDARYNGPEFDGTPAFGKYTNLTLADNGMVVYADLVGCPKWLADIMPTAYPSRSIEGFWNVESQAGKKWRFVLSAVSALGVMWPGVTVLEDLPLYYGDEVPEGVVVDEELIAAAKSGGDPTPKLRFKKDKTSASANLDDVRRAFYEDYNDPDTFWWWIRAVLTDPNELVVEDDEDGQLYLIPFTSDAKGAVSFGESSPVRVEYVADDRAAQKAAAVHVAASAVAAAQASGRTVLATFDTRASSRPDQPGGGMDPAEIRQRLNLPEDATDEQVQEAAAALASAAGVSLQEPSGEGGEGSPGTHKGVTPAGTGGAEPVPAGGEEPQPTPAPVPASPGPEPAPEQPAQQAAQASTGETVTIDRGTLEELQRGARAGISLLETNEERERTDLVAAAIGDGRIPPARRDHWLDALKKDFEGNKAILASIAPGLIPVELREIGNSGDPDLGGGEEVTDWTRSLFPETQRFDEQVAASGGRRPLVQREDPVGTGGTV